MIGFGEREIYILAKGYFFAKVVSRHEDEKMSNDFENSQEYRKAHEITKKQEELYKKCYESDISRSVSKISRTQ